MSGEFSGRLSERVQLSTPPETRDAAGGMIGAWTTSPPAWAAVEVARHGARSDGERLLARPRYTVTMRGGVSPKPGDRLQWGGRSLHVLSVTRDPEQADRVTVLAEERS